MGGLLGKFVGWMDCSGSLLEPISTVAAESGLGG